MPDIKPDAVKYEIRECVVCPQCDLTVNGLCVCGDAVQCNVCGFCATAAIGVKCLSEKQPACFGRMFIEPAVIDADWRCAPDFDQQDAFIAVLRTLFILSALRLSEVWAMSQPDTNPEAVKED